jgi:hypothetical protein
VHAEPSHWLLENCGRKFAGSAGIKLFFENFKSSRNYLFEMLKI